VDYRIFRILTITNNAMNMEYYLSFIEPTVLSSIMFIDVLVVFAVIRLSHSLEHHLLLIVIQVGLVAIVYEYVSLQLMASVFELSQKYIRLGRRLFRTKTFLGKVFKSLRPARIDVGAFYVEKSTIFVYFDACITHTINFLLL